MSNWQVYNDGDSADRTVGAFLRLRVGWHAALHTESGIAYFALIETSDRTELYSKDGFAWVAEAQRHAEAQAARILREALEELRGEEHDRHR